MITTLELPAMRSQREQLLDLAHECADYIVERNPYLKLVAVSGSLTREEHQGDHEDIDFFVVTQQDRIWEAFLGCLLHGWRFARSRGLDRTFFCFNYLVDEAHPYEIDLRRREYVREFLNLHVLHGMETYRRLLQEHEERLQQSEPALYEQTLCRVSRAPEYEPRPEVSAAAGFAYRLAAPAFRLLAKRMEARRRRAYPGGYVYSSSRVIRSHFRRAWQADCAEEDGLPAARAFDAIAETYQDEVVSSPANEHMREVVWGELSKLLRPDQRVLDLGCGTGTDAIRLANAGVYVLAVDVSQGMVEEARCRVEAAGVSHRVEVRRLAIENLSTLLPEHSGAFDIVLCNFGALNLAGEPSLWSPVVARLLRPDGHLIASVMNRWCLPELLAGLLRLRPSFALRRAGGATVPVGGVPLATTLYTPGGFARGLRASFRMQSVRGLCALFPPPTLERSSRQVTSSNWLRAADRILGRVPGLRALGDHFLAVMRPCRDGYVLFDAGASVTASPVVDDLNGDGASEVVLAADRLYVLDANGKPLQGWPRKASKPLASTPYVARDGENAALYIGSDDHGLHGFDLAGRRLLGFPYETGGDVFSSSWHGDLDGDGSDEIAFGSDDGNVYLIDTTGRSKPRWPVPTAGYISASPAVARTRSGQALFIGSWDGGLYGLDAYGKPLPGWPRRLGFPVWSTAAIADLDGDGYAEIVVGAHRLFALRGTGEALPGFPKPLTGYAVGSPAVADLDGDGRPEIVIASDRVYAFRGDGAGIEGFPVDLGAHVWASPLLVDVDGDGRPEIVVADMQGRVWVITASGHVLDSWPRQAGRRIAATPTAADLDKDGYLELLVATWEGRVVVYPTSARANEGVASPWRSFPRRSVPDEPILESPAGRPAEIANAASPRCMAPVNATVHLEPRRPAPYRVTDVHLAVETAEPIEAGLLHYELDGRLHPSPLLGRDGRYFGIVQPLPPLKRLSFHFELLTESGASVRVPERGDYEMTVGRAGVRGLERGQR